MSRTRINPISVLQCRKFSNHITRSRPFQPQSTIDDSTDSLPSHFDDLIRGLSTQNLPHDALSVFKLMRQRGVRPSNFTYPFVIKASASLVALNEGKQVHGDALKHGFQANVYVGNSLVRFYGCCEDIGSAYKVFDEMSVRTLVSWNSLIGSCVDNSRFQDALGVFTRMQTNGFAPDQTTMVALLSSSTEQGNLSLGRWVHCQVVVNALAINCQLGTALVEMYAKCGNLNYSSLVFDRMRDRNVWTWSSMILGLAQHGLFREALKLYSEMVRKSISPNHVTFLAVLSACSHGGLIDEGYRYYREMEHEHGIKPTLAHYGAMVDMLCRAGFLKEAYRFIQKMHVESDAVVWRTLLSACSLHRVEDCDRLATKAMGKLMELEPERIGNFVIAANKYSSIGRWEEAAVCRSSSNKIAGESCIELEGLIHRFVSGNGNCKNQLAMSKVLEALNLHMKKVVEC